MEYIHVRMIETTKTCLQLAPRVVNLEDHRIKAEHLQNPTRQKSQISHVSNLSFIYINTYIIFMLLNYR